MIMKHQRLCSLFIFSFFAFFVTAQTSWTRLTPTPQENSINCITKIPGTNKLIAIGEGSTLMMSNDVGESWELLLNPAEMNNDYLCKGIHYINENTGFINGGNETILKTMDGGFTWNLKYMSSTIYEWQCINDIEFLDESTGYAIGDNGQLFKTSDVGETWTLTESGVSFNLMNIAFANLQTGFIIGNTTTTLLKTQDGGNSWLEMNYPDDLPSTYLEEIYFVNETTGFIFTVELPNYDGLIFKTIDSGETWTEVFSDPSSYSAKFAFFDDLHGIAGCNSWMYSSKVLLTNDGGNNWSEISLPGLSWFGTNSLCYFDQNNAFSVGMHGRIYKSSNGGALWEEKFQRTFWGDIYEVQFINGNVAFALAESWTGGVAYSELMKTQDGGNTWFSTAGILNYDGAFNFVNQALGFLVSKVFSLTIQKTLDGGNSWTEFDTGFDFDPFCIKFYDSNNGLITSEGHVIRTSDSGNNWEQINSGVGWSASYTDIEYRSINEIFMAGGGTGSNTFLARSTDGGTTWLEDSIGNRGEATDLYFLDENTAFATCLQNAILKSNDGGETWNETTLNNLNPIEFKSIFFPSQFIGYALGDGQFETILKTIDGGDTWNPINAHATSGLNCLHFFDDNTGLVFGDGGVVMKTTTGGITGFEEPSLTISGKFMEIYPNPSTDEVNIRINQTLLNTTALIIIYDCNGQKMETFPISPSMESIKVSTVNLKPGIYFYQLKTESGITETMKMIKF
jgi:photosystem II stability/assembly factor-like uncharacterized protein